MRKLKGEKWGITNRREKKKTMVATLSMSFFLFFPAFTRLPAIELVSSSPKDRSFLSSPPSAYFQALPIREASLLEQIGNHGSPPPVPFISGLTASFHEDMLHALNHLNYGQKGRAPNRQLICGQLSA